MNQLIDQMILAVDQQLREVVSLTHREGQQGLYEMLSYHLGWDTGSSNQPSSGKRIRPVLLLLTCASIGQVWSVGIPAACAVELVHNFSLIHDDIQDASDLRRGRETVWRIWGIPQSINAGDALFALAQLSMLDLADSIQSEITLRAARILNETCQKLTHGQYLDIAFELQDEIDMDTYWTLIAGKTAALISACTEIGALIGGASEFQVEAYRNFGLNLGLAFQVRDDFLGIWGNENLFGKSIESDLVSKKKTLPIIFGIRNNGHFAQLYKGEINDRNITELVSQLDREGAREYTYQCALDLTDKALNYLNDAVPKGEAGEALFELTHKLLDRFA